VRQAAKWAMGICDLGRQGRRALSFKGQAWGSAAVLHGSSAQFLIRFGGQGTLCPSGSFKAVGCAGAESGVHLLAHTTPAHCL